MPHVQTPERKVAGQARGDEESRASGNLEGLSQGLKVSYFLAF